MAKCIYFYVYLSYGYRSVIVTEERYSVCSCGGASYVNTIMPLPNSVNAIMPLFSGVPKKT